jgi:hypothetical protein
MEVVSERNMNSPVLHSSNMYTKHRIRKYRRGLGNATEETVINVI